MLFNSYTDCSTSDTEYTDPSGTFEFTTGFCLLCSCCLTVIRTAPLVVQNLPTLQEHLSSLRVFVAGFVLFNSNTDSSTSGT